MKTVMIRLPILIGLLALAACSSEPPVELDTATKAQIDCLAAQTVAAISKTTKEGIVAGIALGDLRSVKDDKIAEYMPLLKTAYPGKASKAHFNAEIKLRLNAIQNAVGNTSPAASDVELMDATFELAKSCDFEGS